MENNEEKLKISFDINLIEHLGIKLYSTIPPMIAELVSNAWDADAHNVYLKFINEPQKRIEIVDDGHGMNFSELNESFLKIGRNRRVSLGNDKTPSGRNVLGKKGLGKLSMFGIGKNIEVSTVKSGIENRFVMNFNKLKEKSEEHMYEPEIIKHDVLTDEHDGTTIIITEIGRKTDFNIGSIRNNLLKRFKIFSDDFIVHINDDPELEIKANLLLEDKCQFKWNFPTDFEADFAAKEENLELYNFGVEKKVVGTIMTSETPISNEEQGIVLYSRNKLVNENDKFNSRGNDNFFQYMFGSFDVDFVDADKTIDNCSTDRKSLAWDNYENEELDSLHKLLCKIVDFTQKKWREKRSKEKEIKVTELGVDVEKWLNSLNQTEKGLAKKLTSAILENDKIDEETSAEYISTIKDMYGFQGFKDFTQKLSDLDSLGNENAIKLLTDWKNIEDKEYAKIAMGRIETINQFEKFINEDASETKVIQKFLEEFPWLLDPKMSKFEREVTYSELLKKKFPEIDVPEHNRRLDFLCNNDAGIIHIIELKRPSVKIGDKQLNQIRDYVAFFKTLYPSKADSVVGFLISNNITTEPNEQITIKALESQKIYVRTYTELLTEAREYNKKFFDKYYELEESQKITLLDFNK